LHEISCEVSQILLVSEFFIQTKYFSLAANGSSFSYKRRPPLLQNPIGGAAAA
jgi:hypothetical protein